MVSWHSQEIVMVEAIVNVVCDLKLMCKCVLASQVIAIAVTLIR